jgi:RNA polymerase sigma factor (sigma-70 family)
MRLVCILWLLTAMPLPAAGNFDIQFSIVDEAQFTPESLALLKDALLATEQLWEGILLGHQHHNEPVVFPIEIGTFDAGLAWGNYDGSFQAGDFVLPTQGGVYINPLMIPNAVNGFGVSKMNLLDDVIAHEVGHVLGIGTLWAENAVYVQGSGQYTGAHGLQAYRDEFDPDADFIPVELAGGQGVADAHWDQILRWSAEEGDPRNPLSLSPLLGIVDDRGRDFGMEQMTSTLDPDYGAPFLSNTTVQSLRDLGYTVVGTFPRNPGDLNEDGLVNVVDIDILRACRASADAECLSDRFDLDGDGTMATFDDLMRLVRDYANTYFGDANVDGEFNSGDFVTVLAAGEYEDEIAGNSTWATGDWNADGDFTSADLIVALAEGGYEIGPRAAVASVPEPNGFMLLTFGCIAILSLRKCWSGRSRGTHRHRQTIGNHDSGTTQGDHSTRTHPLRVLEPQIRPLSEAWFMTRETSIGWLNSLKRGGPYASGWGYLVGSYGPFLRGILARRGLKDEAADDVVQNVLLVIVRRLPEFERQRTGSFRSWLRSITVNCLRDYWKAEGRNHPATGNSQLHGVIEELQDAESELSQIWNREHAHHVVGLLLDAIQNDFEPRTIAIFKQLTLAKAPVDEVAGQFQITPNACFIARSRVMKRLKTLSRELFGADDSLDGLGR